MRQGNAQNNWRERYSREVERATRKHEQLNTSVPTITRQITPEEIEEYNQRLHTANYFKLHTKQESIDSGHE